MLLALTNLFATRAAGQDVEWAKQLTGSLGQYIHDVALDANGNVYVTGYVTGTPDFDPGPGTASFGAAQGSDIFIAKYNGQGGYLWARHFIGSRDDLGWGIAVDGTNVYVTGAFGGTIDFDPGTGVASRAAGTDQSDVIFAKYTLDGNYVWAYNMGGTVSGNGGAGYDIALDASNVYLTGEIYGGAVTVPGRSTTVSGSTNGMFVAKYTKAGVYQWISTTGNGGAEGHGIALSNGNIYATGRFTGTLSGTTLSATNGSALIVKYSSTGTRTWVTRVGGQSQDMGYGITAIGTALYVTGYLATSPVSTFLRRYNDNTSSAALGWSVLVSSSGGGSGYNITNDGTSVYVTGAFEGANANFNPLGTAVNLSSTPFASSAFLCKYNSNGINQWAKAISGSNSSATGHAIAVQSGAVYAGGFFGGTTNFNVCGGSLALTANETDAFLAKYSASPVSLAAQGATLVCSSGATVTLPNVPAGASVTWTASSGMTPASGSGASATVSAVSGFSGNGSVTFNVSGTCGNTTARRDVWVSIPTKPSLSFFGTITSTVTCAYNTFQVTASTTGTHDPNGWTWSVTGGTLIDGLGSSTVTIQAPGPGQGIYIQVGVPNACGYSYYYHTLEAVSEYGGQYCFEEPMVVSVSPNPAADYVDIDPTASSEYRSVKGQHYQVALYDKYGQEVTSVATRQKGEKLRLNVKPYRDGLYFIRVTYPGGLLSRQLVIKH